MMKLFADIRDSLIHFAFPHVCQSCGTDLLQPDHQLCLHCLNLLPVTEFHHHSNNPVEKMFWGRLPLAHATAQYYFTKESMMQRLMHQLKYRGNKDLGFYLGRLMGSALKETNRFSGIDVLVPLPLFPSKEKKRGYNQAKVLCDGLGEILGKPVLTNSIIRTTNTDSQTRKNRIQRWLNMEGRFELKNADDLKGRHVLLVDDVVTTGATLEACGREILEAEDVILSVATLCYSSH